MVSQLMNTVNNSMEDLLEWFGVTAYQAVALVAGPVIVIYSYSKVFAKKYKLAPGPIKFPIIGNMPQLLFSKLSAPDNFYQMSKTYGPVIRNKIMGLEFIVLNDLSVIREALVVKQDDFSNRPVLWTGQVMSDGGKDILWGNPSSVWKYQRQIVHQAIRKYASGDNLEWILLGIQENVITMVKKEKGPQFVNSVTRFIAYNLITGLGFGKQYAPDDETFLRFRELSEKFNSETKWGIPVDFMPYLAYCPLLWPMMRRFKNRIKLMTDFVKENIKEHRRGMEEGDGTNIKDITDYIIAQAEQGDSSKKDLITEDYLVNTVFDVYGAGLDTTDKTLDWLIGYLMIHPEIQTRLHKEIDAVYEPGTSLTDIRHKVPFVEAVIYEAMRLETIAPLGLPLCTGVDTTVGGYDVPKGCIVFPNIWALHHSKEHWEKPDQFKPDRFLNDDGSLRQRLPYFLPFSLGRRQCIGEVVAKSSLVMIVILLFYKFRFSIPPDCPDWKLKEKKFGIFNRALNYTAVIEERH